MRLIIPIMVGIVFWALAPIVAPASEALVLGAAAGLGSVLTILSTMAGGRRRY